jgi:hypothetical protein
MDGWEAKLLDKVNVERKNSGLPEIGKKLL